MILGIDTSNYTTSMCLIDDNENIIFERAILLKVKQGEKGLRQSEAFFQHGHQLTHIFESLSQEISPQNIGAIAVSENPRYRDDSYMPVFEAGVLFARNLASALNISYMRFSHQEGHLAAAIKTSVLDVMPQAFVGMHLSGGTTEILACKLSNDRIKSDIIGGTLDVNFGQIIDRLGVALGLPFPCGQALDAMASQVETSKSIKIKAIKDKHFNISGLENQLAKLLETESPDTVARILFNTLGDLLLTLIDKINTDLPVVISGGVSSNTIIRNYLKIHYKKANNLFFSQPQYAKDNAYGIALLGKRSIQNA